MAKRQTFPVLLRAERRARQKRRCALGEMGYTRAADAPHGLALSGGGIRSAAFCIGVMQALEEAGQPRTTGAPTIVLPNFDYISSVSGGGYAAAGLIHHASKDCVPQKPPPPLFAYGKADEDTGLMNSLRNHSNYLFAGRMGWHVLVGLAMYLRVLAISVVTLTPAVVFFAVIMALAQHAVSFLRLSDLTPWLAALAMVPVLSAIPNRSGGPFEKDGPRGLAALLAGVLALAAIGAGLVVMAQFKQPMALDGMQFVVPGGALAGFFVLQSQALLKLAGREAAATLGGWARQNSARIALAFAALVLPLALWLVGLWLALVLSDLNPPKHPALVSGLAVLAVLWAFESFYGGLIDIDRNSMSEFYRRGLAKAFLPKIEPDWNLTQARLDILPYPILNASISTVGSSKNRRRRNATGFVMTPCHYGCDDLGFARMKAAAGDLDLSKAMAISGAAAAPNMGLAVRAPGLAFSLAFLGARLGRWMPNPQHMPVGHAPIAGLRRLWQEALGRSGRNLPHGKLVLLSDGGHSDNLGVTELLRRKCRLIVAVDGEQDPDMRCGALTQLMRLARIDMGITIRIDLRPLAASHAEAVKVVQSGLPNTSATPRYHAALGLIHYSDRSTGYLLYIKATLTGDEFAPIQSYARRHPIFPHESTADQAFDEEQFEAYRALGSHAARDVVKGRALWVHQDLYPQSQQGPVSFVQVLGWLKV